MTRLPVPENALSTTLDVRIAQLRALVKAGLLTEAEARRLAGTATGELP